MAALTPRLWWLVAALLLWTPQAQSKELTNTDIREAMVSIVHLLRLVEDKLERHEHREKTQGDSLKRLLISVDRKLRELEPVKGTVSRLDERLSNVETIMLHNDQRERTNQKITNEAIENLNKSIQTLTTTVEALKADKSNDLDNNLITNDDSIERRLDVTDSKIHEVKTQIDNMKENLNVEALRSVCREVATNTNPFEKHISDAEKLLNKYELKLNEFNETKVPTDIVPLSDVAMADEAWHSKMTDEMERQGKEVTKIQKLLSDAEGVWKQLPKLSDLQTANNLTLAALSEAAEKHAENMDKSVTKVGTKIRDLSDRLLATNEDIQRSLTEGNTLTERTYNRVSEGYDALQNQVQKFSKCDEVLAQATSNNKRIEYGIHQILSEVKELLLNQGKKMNDSIADRLNAIEAAIMGNQFLTQVNLSSKIESESAQVWRQISILHAQLKASQALLDTLSERTDEFVSNSTVTMGKVKTDVSTIRSQMLKLNEDFNFALGELGVATTEFRRMAVAMTMSRAPADKVADAGPGPHNLTSAEITY